MKLFHKRLLILFSVALNIGFIIVAVGMIAHHPRSSHQRSSRAIVDMVQQLNLPKSQERAVVETIARFRTQMDQYDQDLKNARGEVVRYLAADGPVDLDRLHRLTEAIGAADGIKNKAFEAHFLDLRHQLGDEKGARFFTLLLAHLAARDSTPRP